MEDRPRLSPLDWMVVAWGVGGVLALLANAIVRLSPIAAEALTMELGALHWAVLAGWVAFMGYAEGWRGFHRRFSPRVVARAFHLGRRRRLGSALLAPAYCMSLFASTRRGTLVAWSLVVGISALVVLVRMTPQPWRGIVDAGVVIGLGVGSLSIGWHVLRSLRLGPQLPTDLPPGDLPQPAGQSSRTAA